METKTGYRKFFLKNLLILIIPILSPVLILGSYFLYLTETVLPVKSREELFYSSSLVKAQLDIPFMDAESLLLLFSEDPSTINFTRGILSDNSLSLDEIRALHLLQATISSFINTKPYFYSVYVYSNNPNDRFLSSSSGIVDQTSFWDCSWLEVARNMGMKEIHSYRRTVKQLPSDTQGKDVISVIIKNSALNGFIVINYDAAYFEKVLESTLKEKDAFLFFAFDESNNQIITWPNELTIDIQTLDCDELKIGESSYLISKSTSVLADWKFVLLKATDNAYSLSKLIRNTMFALLLLSILLSLGIALYITKKNNTLLKSIITFLEEMKNPNSTRDDGKKLDSYTSLVKEVLKVFMEKDYLEAQQKGLELTALQAQINPHFLFNTLNGIYWETIKLGNGPSTATEMLESLTGILEYSISDPMEKVPIRAEIEYTKEYLSIQSFRFPGLFEVEWNIQCHTPDIKSMKLLIQPIVENAIGHGFKGCVKKDLLLKITIEEKEQTLYIEVEDNGNGIEADKLESIQKKLENPEYSAEIGLVNTARRIKVFYGNSADIIISSHAGIGTSIKMWLPLKTV